MVFSSTSSGDCNVEEETSGKIASTSLNQIQLIDQFLENLPTLTRLKKAGNEEPELEIDLSESNWRLPASETFAMILEKQGKYQQAIEVYQKLILLNHNLMVL